MTRTRRGFGWSALVALALQGGAASADLTARRGQEGGACGESLTRWLSTRSSTPLASVNDHGIHSGRVACCAPWSRRGARFFAVDAFGQTVGKLESVGGDTYDVTGCFQPNLRVLEGKRGVGLAVSIESGWRPPPSPRWIPSPEERAGFDRLAAAAKKKRRAAEPIFFQTAAGARFAVAGGATLLVASLDGAGRWTTARLERDPDDGGATRSPIAVFDLDGDGVPEIIFHEDFGDSWNDSILQLRDDGRGWQKIATGVYDTTA